MSAAYNGPKTSDFRVWHVPQIPMRAFVVDCDTVEEAWRVQQVLAFYDLFQYENRVKPDYSNASGVLQWVPDENEYVDMDETELEAYENAQFEDRLRTVNLGMVEPR